MAKALAGGVWEGPAADAFVDYVTQITTAGAKVQGHLDDTWAAWFDPLTIANTDDGEAVLGGYLCDQPALHGVLIKVRDLGLPHDKPRDAVFDLVKERGRWRIHDIHADDPKSLRAFLMEQNAERSHPQKRK